MRISSMKKIALLACVLTVWASCLLYIENEQRLKNIHGNLLFSSAEKIENVKKIKIKSARNQVTIYQDENMWKVLEADNYYADLNLVRMLLERISMARTGNEIPAETLKDSEWISISLYGASDQKLDEVQLSNPYRSGSHNTRSEDGKKIYATNWVVNIPDQKMSWTNHPLIRFDSIEIKSIENNGKKITRDYKGMPFSYAENKFQYNTQKHTKVFDVLTGLWYDDVLSSQEFDEKKYSHQQQLKLTSFDGLETEITLYTDNKEYWAKINISTNKLPTQEVKNYVANNSFLYEDWWFKLTPEEGKALFLFQL